jgi:glycosyltransferase involved in cell wall biosynthesis
MKTKSPLVSVIIPAYNAAAFIRQTLESVLAQTYQNLEVLVVDDGSQDQTAEIVTNFTAQDKRVKLFRQSNAGVAAARNFAIAQSRGAYIAPIDADDIWYPQKLEKQVECLNQADAKVGLVYTWSVYIDELGDIIGKYTLDRAYKPEGSIYPMLVCSNFLDNASNPLIRRECIEQVGNYNTHLRACNAQGCEDWDLYLRIAEFYQFRVVPEYLVGYRQFIGSMAHNCQAMAKSYNLVMQSVQEKHPEIPPVIYQWSRSFFYHYLLGKSYKCGDHENTLRWLSQTVQEDWYLLLRPGLYQIIFVCFCKIAVHPLASRVWPSHQSWLQFRQKFRWRSRSLTIEEINQKSQQHFYWVWKPYDLIVLKRWQQALEICQELTLKPAKPCSRSMVSF